MWEPGFIVYWILIPNSQHSHLINLFSIIHFLYHQSLCKIIISRNNKWEEWSESNLELILFSPQTNFFPNTLKFKRWGDMETMIKYQPEGYKKYFVHVIKLWIIVSLPIYLPMDQRLIFSICKLNEFIIRAFV